MESRIETSYKLIILGYNFILVKLFCIMNWWKGENAEM